jgi:hypothetical protein
MRRLFRALLKIGDVKIGDGESRHPASVIPPSHRSAAASAMLVAAGALALHGIGGAGMIDRPDHGIGAGRQDDGNGEDQGDTAHPLSLGSRDRRITTQECERRKGTVVGAIVLDMWIALSFRLMMRKQSKKSLREI